VCCIASAAPRAQDVILGGIFEDETFPAIPAIDTAQPDTAALENECQPVHDTVSDTGASTQHAPGPAPKAASTHKPFAFARFNSAPENAVVYMDGDSIGVTPCEADSFPPGLHTIEIHASGYKAFSRAIAFKENVRKKLSVTLSPLYGFVTINSSPSGASAYIDSQFIGVTPVSERQLKPGVYSLRLSAEEYKPVQRNIYIALGRKDTLNLVLGSLAYLDSIKTMRLQRFQTTRRVMFGILAATFAGAGIYANIQAAESLEKEEAALQRYKTEKLSASEYEAHWRKYDALRSDTDDAMRKRTVFYTIAGVGALGFAISIKF